MRKLVEQCSKHSNLIHAMDAMGLKDEQRQRLLEHFKDLGISPVTLDKDSPFDRLESIASLLSIE